MTSRFILHAGDDERMRILANCCHFLGTLPPTKSWKIEISEYRKSRTDPQNHALFGVAYPALEAATGFTKDELHEAFCRRHFGSVAVEVMGQVVSRPFRTTTTDENGKRDVIGREEFGRFYDMVMQVGAEAGIYVPAPVPDGVRAA